MFNTSTITLPGFSVLYNSYTMCLLSDDLKVNNGEHIRSHSCFKALAGQTKRTPLPLDPYTRAN